MLLLGGANLLAQTGIIGRSDLNLKQGNQGAYLEYNVSMALGYRTNCPGPLEVAQHTEGDILFVNVLFDGTAFKLGCGCESKNEIWIQEDVRLADINEIRVVSDLLLKDIDGGVRTLENEDTHVLFNNTLGAQEVFSALDEVKLYPNPTKDILNVEVPSGVSVDRLYISASNGILVRNLDSDQRLIEVADLAQGTYYLWLVYQNESVVRSFVVGR